VYAIVDNCCNQTAECLKQIKPFKNVLLTFITPEIFSWKEKEDSQAARINKIVLCLLSNISFTIYSFCLAMKISPPRSSLSFFENFK